MRDLRGPATDPKPEEMGAFRTRLIDLVAAAAGLR
jgi:hypothetical protein